MKRTLCGILSLSMLLIGCGAAAAEGAPSGHRLLYQGHGSLRIVTAQGKVIYIDPYAGDGYDLPADLILVSHAHQDHSAVSLIGKKNEGCRTITWKEALADGKYNMDMDEAIACAKTVNARYSIPYHMAPGKMFDPSRAALFDVPNRLIIPAGEEIKLE